MHLALHKTVLRDLCVAFASFALEFFNTRAFMFGF